MKLHIGCGIKYMLGFVHIDINDYFHIDYNRDVRDLSFIQGCSVDLIYASHVLEYFDPTEVVNVLLEWKRVLKHGGILRLAVPDFKALVRVYLEEGNMKSIEGVLTGAWKIGTDTTIYHKTVYDFNRLMKLLIDCGFYAIRRWDWKRVFVGELEGYDDYSQAYIPHMDKENGTLISLNVEAEK